VKLADHPGSVKPHFTGDFAQMIDFLGQVTIACTKFKNLFGKL